MIETPLSDNEKVPILSSRMQELVSSDSEIRDICTNEDVELLFRPSAVSTPLDQIFFTVLAPPPTDGTEELFYSFWDDNIRTVLELLVPLGSSMRNWGKHTVTRALHPDYAFLLGKLCPFRGEERPPGSSEDLKTDLSNKFEWLHAPAPYVLGKLYLFHDTVFNCSCDCKVTTARGQTLR